MEKKVKSILLNFCVCKWLLGRFFSGKENYLNTIRDTFELYATSKVLSVNFQRQFLNSFTFLGHSFVISEKNKKFR